MPLDQSTAESGRKTYGSQQYELIESIKAIVNAGHSISGAGVRGLLGVIDQQKMEIERLRVYALRWESIQEMLSGTTVQVGNERLWTIRTPLAPDRVYRNHMTEFRASVDVYMSQFAPTVPQRRSEGA